MMNLRHSISPDGENLAITTHYSGFNQMPHHSIHRGVIILLSKLLSVMIF